jgi:hypothetical protein
MKKPTKKTKSYYDYIQCRDYLQKKYDYNERDYAGKFKNRDKEDVPYQDFWHWVIEHYQVCNGCFITFSKEYLECDGKESEAWVREIYKHYIDEFADENGELEMYCWW